MKVKVAETGMKLKRATLPLIASSLKETGLCTPECKMGFFPLNVENIIEMNLQLAPVKQPDEAAIKFNKID